jgi:hypothetical protein
LNRKTLITLFIFFCCLSYSSSAQKVTVYGYVYDQQSNEALIGAYIKDTGTGNTTKTNAYGYYSIKTTSKTSLIASYVGYNAEEKLIIAASDTAVNFNLNAANELEEITVTGKSSIITETEINTINLNVKDLKIMPVFGGESDILKAIQSVAGIQSGNEGTTGLYVRGGSPDQNLFLLDGVPLYNVSHLFGFMSVFNDDAINNIKVIKGGFPASYGGRLSSVLDIRMKEGNLKKHSGNISVGLISSKAMIEGPIKKDTASFLLSARRTYIDAFLRPYYYFVSKKDNDQVSAGYFFYDITAKINWKLSSKDRLYLSWYSGKDNYYSSYQSERTNENNEFFINDRRDLYWKNRLLNLRHSHIFSKNLFFNANLYYSYYNLTNNYLSQLSSAAEGDTIEQYNQLKYSSKINDFGLSLNLDYYINTQYFLKTGFNAVIHNFLPGIKTHAFNEEGNEVLDETGSREIMAKEFRYYIENHLKASENLKFNGGVNFSLFHVEDTSYYSIEPRLSGIFIINSNNSVKAGYTHAQQYLHLLTNSNIGLPTDIWVPPTSKIAPQKARQYTVGYYTKMPAEISLSIEVYHKKISNLITYTDNTSYFIEDQNWDDKVYTEGNGKAYGAEISINKKTNRLNINFAYTLSRSTRQFDEINKGKEYVYKYDRTHDISVNLTYKIKENITLSTNWVYGTGNALTLPVAVYPSVLYPPDRTGWSFYGDGLPISFPGQTTHYRDKTELFIFSEKNAYRLPAYHRLDINLTMTKQKKRGIRTFNIGLYNAYNHHNPYYLVYAYNSDASGNLDASGEFRTVSLFPVMPTISYSFKF